jgi:HNH endonuclease
MSALKVERLRELLEYDAASGIFTWRARPVGRQWDKMCNTQRAGRVAGSFNLLGYWRIGIDGRSHLAHRLAWAWVNGEWPKAQIDHKNLDKGDNRFSNLREATSPQGNANRRSSNKSGFKCVSKSWSKWRAEIKSNGKLRHLGCFARIEHAAYIYHVAAVW